METTRKFAILAPVPEIHLVSGLEAIAAQVDSDDVTAQALPKVAFGSMAFEILRKADELRKERSVEVLIYASDSEGDRPLNSEVSWRARYIGIFPLAVVAIPANLTFALRLLLLRNQFGLFTGKFSNWRNSKLQFQLLPSSTRSKTNCKSRFVPESPVLNRVSLCRVFSNLPTIIRRC
jgi:hypothetical protein